MKLQREVKVAQSPNIVENKLRRLVEGALVRRVRILRAGEFLGGSGALAPQYLTKIFRAGAYYSRITFHIE